MDLGISGKKAIVCASSKGLGLGCARALAEAGVDVVMNARTAEVLEASAEAVRSEFGVTVQAVPGDIATEAGRAAVLEAAGPVDILVTNAGGPPPGMWSDWSRDDFVAALDANMLTPIAMMQACLPGMMERGWGRVVNITSQSSLDGNVVKARGITMEEAKAERCATIPAGRYGTADEFGSACAFLCSTNAGFIVGQNILLDGGATNATI